MAGAVAPTLQPGSVAASAAMGAALTSAASDLPAYPIVEFPAAGGAVWYLGDGFKGSIDGAAFSFIPFLGADAPQNFPVELRLNRVVAGGHDVAIDAGPSRIKGHRVEVPRAGLLEYYDVTPGAVEQSFRFDTLPARGRIDLEFGLTTELEPAPQDSGLVFRHARGSVTYTEAVAVDGVGARCPVAIALEGATVRLSVPAEFVGRAVLPLVVDPRVNANTLAQATPAMIDPDVAWNQASDEFLCVWVQPYSATDQDVWARRFDRSLAPIGAAFTIDHSSLSWWHARVASRPATDDFLVVAQVNSATSAPYWIGGRMVIGSRSGGGSRPQFDVERGGVIGLAGNAFRPDVGSDRYLGTTSVNYTVVFEHETTATNHDIYCKQFDFFGQLGPTRQVSARPGNETNPAISESNGESATSIPLWAVVWQETYAPGDEDILAATLSLGASVVSGPFYLETTWLNDDAPRVSSYTDRFGNDRYFLAVYQHDYNPFNNTGRVWSTLFTAAGPRRHQDLSQADGSPPTSVQFAPAVDSDGSRFVVTYTESTGSAVDVWASTFAYDPVANGVQVQDARASIGTTGDQEHSSAVVACDVVAGAPSPYYCTAHSLQYTVPPSAYPNGIVVTLYGGYASSGGFAWRSAGCGNLSMTYVAEPPALGCDLSFSMLTSALGGFLFGYPTAAMPIGVCPTCRLGVAGAIAVPNPYTLRIPVIAPLVGVTFAAQGFTISTGPCLSAIRFTDVLDITVQ